MDKVGDVTITNDGATILQKLEVEHPAAKVLVQLADLQDKEVGDGTTSVVIFAAELLKVFFVLGFHSAERFGVNSPLCTSYSYYERLSSCIKRVYSLYS